MSSMESSAFCQTSDVNPFSLFGYDVIERIGEGAGSVIYVVSQPDTRQLYALKHVVRKVDRDIRFVEQLENEFEVGRQVTHPVLRRCIDIQINRTMLRKVTEAALIMELFDGLPLDMQELPSLSETLGCFIQTAEALGSLHALGYVHCDLKPNNILLNQHGEVKVIDLGQACRTGTAKERIQGTPDYMAPEQVKCKPVDERTDIYNFGATLYWALCNRKLPTLFTLRKSENSFLVDDQLAAPHTINPAVPESLSNLVMECVRTNPCKRPSNMADLARRLELMQHVLRRPTTPRAVMSVA